MQHQVVQAGDTDEVHDALAHCHNKRAFAIVKAHNRKELVSDQADGEAISSVFLLAARSAMREDDFFVGLGELEAVLVFDDLIDEQHAQLAGMKLERIYGQPLGSQAWQYEVSICVVYIARQSLDLDSVQELVEQAREAALSRDRREDGFAFINIADTGDSNPHWLLESRLKEALNNHQVGVDYHAFVNLEDGDPGFVEALPRWRDKGVILAPGDYLPALQNDTLTTFSNYFLRAVIHDIVDQGLHQPVLAHFSNTVLQQHDFAEFLVREINFWGLEPEQIVLGMDVGSYSANSNRHIEGIARRYASIGCRILLRCHDIDRSVWPLLESHADIVRLEPGNWQIQTMAEQPDLSALVGPVAAAKTVIASCVEDADSLESLRRMGVRAGQGFYLSAPMEAQLLATLNPDL